jgi:hypothetical protein
VDFAQESPQFLARFEVFDEMFGAHPGRHRPAAANRQPVQHPDSRRSRFVQKDIAAER